MRLTTLTMAAFCGIAIATHARPADAAVTLQPITVAPVASVQRVDYYWHGARYPYRWRGGYYAYRWHGGYYRHRRFVRGIWRYY